MARVIPVPPNAGAPTAFQQALDAAQPGDVVELQPGEHRYQKPGILRGKSGTAAAPVVIRAAAGAIVRGGVGPEPIGEWNLPDASKWAFLQLIDVEHAVVEDVQVEDCWPSAVYAERSRHLTFRRCTGKGGSFMFVVRDAPPYGYVQDITVDGCAWAQDPRMWDHIPWKQIHDKDQPYGHLNGGLLATGDIVGDVAFTNNTVSDCFNGLVADISPEFRKVGDFRQTNRNVLVANNRFIRVRDNPIEPEWHAFNWHIHHNTFFDCHSWFSFDHVRGGWWYLFANTGWFRTRPGAAIGDGHSTGEVFKMTHQHDPDGFGRVYVFNNSFHLRAPAFGNANDDEPDPSNRFYEFLRWSMLDNAIERCQPTGEARPTCTAIVEAFDPGARVLDGAAFDRTLTNNDAWQKFLAMAGHPEPSPRYLAHPIFVGPTADGGFDFALRQDALAQAQADDFTVSYFDGTTHAMKGARLIGASQPASVAWPPYRRF